MTDPDRESNAPTAPTELFSVAGKTVVVTGGTSGIGLMIAGGFVAAGAEVVVCGRKDPESLSESGEAGGKRASFVACDVRDVERVQ